MKMPVIEFKEFAVEVRKMYQIPKENYFDELAAFFADNDWFGINPEWKDGKMYIDSDAFADVLPVIKQHFDIASLREDEQNAMVEELLAGKAEKTFDKLI